MEFRWTNSDNQFIVFVFYFHFISFYFRICSPFFEVEITAWWNYINTYLFSLGREWNEVDCNLDHVNRQYFFFLNRKSFLTFLYAKNFIVWLQIEYYKIFNMNRAKICYLFNNNDNSFLYEILFPLLETKKIQCLYIKHCNRIFLLIRYIECTMCASVNNLD